MQYDDLNRITQATDPKSSVATQGFDANSNRTTQKDPNNNQTTFAFDAANRLTGITTATGSTSSLTYTHDRLTAITNGRSQSAAFTYYNDGRVQTMTDPAGTISYTYDANGNLLTSTEGGKTSTYQYDLLNRVTSYTDGDGNNILYSYDANSNLTGITYPDNKTVTYTYDAANRMTSVTDWASRVTSYTYDNNGRLLTTTRPNGSIETRTWNSAGQLTRLKDTKADTTTLISQFDYTYDAAGNVLTEANAAVTEPAIATATEAMTYGADNRLETFKGVAVSYDADGNMTSGPINNSTLTLTYDSRNRLTAAGSTTYSYDAANNRIAQTTGGQTTKYVINPVARLSQLLMEKDSNGTAKAYYVYGMGLIGRQDAAGNYAVYHYDRRGSTVALTNAAGTVTDTFSYGPYGELAASSGTTVQPFKYNGRDGVMTDANGLYYMRARYYSPTAKRFINMDSLIGAVDDGQTLNRYAYVNGRPVDMVDPFGLSADKDTGGWLGAGSSLTLDLIPIVGNVKSFGELVTGKDLITGEDRNRFISALGVLPGVAYVAKAGKAVKTIKVVSKALKAGDDVYDALKFGKVISEWNYAQTTGKVLLNEVGQSLIDITQTTLIQGAIRGLQDLKPNINNRVSAIHGV